MKIVIVGASTGVGRALAEEAGRRKHDVVLIASDVRDLSALAAHLKLLYGVNADVVTWHFTSDGAPISQFLEKIRSVRPIDGIFFPIGVAREDDTGSLPESAAREVVEANFLAIANIISGLLPEFRSRGTGYIVGFGSVATIRGRSQNVVYSAAKRALAGYFESLQHQVSGTGIRAQLYILGYIDTPRIAGKKLPFPKCPPGRVADIVFTNLDRDIRTIYYPRFWRLIALILQNMPWAIYKRLPGTS